jgi:uncharacterized protein YndB with AHSA1/START domain
MASPQAIATVAIKAPIEVVWRAMLDTHAYGEWNPFVVRVDRAPGEPVVGQRMRLHVRWASGKGTTSDEEIARVEPPSVEAPRRAALVYAYRGLLHALWLVRGSRFQTLEESADGVTLYRSEETFRGLLASSVPLADVQDGFERHAQALRARAEAMASPA